MTWIEWPLLVFLIACALAVSFSRSLLSSVLIFMAYGLVMAALWALLQAPDLAVTEAAVGAGATSLLLFLALRRVGRVARPTKHDAGRIEGGGGDRHA